MRDSTYWKPERKILAAAVATLIVFIIQAVTSANVPPGVEGAIAIVVGYLVPSRKPEVGSPEDG